MINEQQNMSM